MNILGKNLQFKYENQAVENEEFIKVILDHAASLNVNDNSHSIQLKEVNSISYDSFRRTIRCRLL